MRGAGRGTKRLTFPGPAACPGWELCSLHSHRVLLFVAGVTGVLGRGCTVVLVILLLLLFICILLLLLLLILLLIQQLLLVVVRMQLARLLINCP